MCLRAFSAEKKVAKRNMIVFKRLYFEFGFPQALHFQSFEYKEGEETKTEKMEIDQFDSVSVGYHSWKNPTLIMNAICVIPKGAEYYSGLQYDEKLGYVSSSIVYLGKFSWLKLIKLKLGLTKINFKPYTKVESNVLTFAE